MRQKKSLIIGGGAVGVDFHLPRLKSICGIPEVHIVEPSKLRQEELKAKLSGQNVTIFSGLPQDTTYVHAVIATPPKFHGEYVDRLADRCNKLVIEKPVTRTLAEAEAIVERLKQSNTIAFICHIRRTLKSFGLVKQLVATSMFGGLQSVRVREGDVFNWRAASIGSFSRDLNGGGVLLDTGPHTLDLMFQVFDHLKLKHALMDADIANNPRAIEANCQMKFETDTCIPVDIAISRNRKLSNKAYFHFEQATVSVSLRDNTLGISMGESCNLYCVPDMRNYQEMAFGDLFDAFYLQFVVPGDNTGVSPSDALPIMRIIDDAYAKSSKIEVGF